MTVIVATLAGCTASGGLLGSPPSTALPGSATPRRAEASDGVLIYLETMRDLLEGDPVLQADVFSIVAQAANVEPNTTNRLNYALALATPGHPSSNPAEAQHLLSEILAASDTLLPEERILATIHLKEVEQRLILDAAAQRLQQEAAAATAQQSNQSAQRLRAMAEENRQLRLELDEALEKLDAITNIERSIRERENGSDPQ
jgi:regulator of replication initiation timing